MVKPKKKNPLRKLFKKTNNQDELVTTTSTPSSKKLHEMGAIASTTDPGRSPRRKSKGFFSGLKGVVHKGKDLHSNTNSTFMTAETEEASGDDASQHKNANLDLFPGLQPVGTSDFNQKPDLAAESVSDSSTPNNASSEEGQPENLQIWKEFVSENDGNLELGLSATADADANADVSTAGDEFVADFNNCQDAQPRSNFIPGAGAVPYDDYSQSAYRHQIPDTVNFEAGMSGGMSIVSDFGLESAYVMPHTHVIEPFANFEEAEEIPGFLSAEQEQIMGMQVAQAHDERGNADDFIRWPTPEGSFGDPEMVLASDADRFADADEESSADEEVLEPSIEAQIDTPRLESSVHFPDVFDTEFEAFFTSEESWGTNDPSKVSITSHPIMMQQSNDVTPQESESKEVVNSSGMAVPHAKGKKTLKSLVRQQQQAKLSNADVSSYCTKSVDGRSYRSYSSGEQTLKTENTENSHRRFDEQNTDLISSSRHESTMASIREPPGTYAAAAAAASHELSRSASDPNAHGDFQLATTSDSKPGHPGLPRPSTVPAGRGEPGFSTQRRAIQSNTKVEPENKDKDEYENEDEDMEDSEPLLPPASDVSDINSSAPVAELDYDGDEDKTVEMSLDGSLFSDSNEISINIGSGLEGGDEFGKELALQESEQTKDSSQQKQKLAVKVPSEAGSSVTQPVANGLLQDHPFQRAPSQTSQMVTPLRNNYRKLCAQLLQERVEEKRRNSSGQLIPPSYISDTGSEESASPDRQSIGDIYGKDELKAFDEYLSPSSPEKSLRGYPDVVEDKQTEMSNLEVTLDSAIVLTESQEEALMDEILQPSYDEADETYRDVSYKSEPSATPNQVEDTERDSDAEESVEVGRKSPKRRASRKDEKGRSSRERMNVKEKRNGRRSDRRRPKDDERSEATGATGATGTSMGTVKSFIKSLENGALNRITEDLNCSFFSGADRAHEDSDSDDDIECDDDIREEEAEEEAEDDSILSSDDESSVDSRQRRRHRRKMRIEEDVEDALEWADENLVFCNTRC